MFFGGAPPSMNRQVWIARKIEFPWQLAPKQCFLDCQPTKKNMARKQPTRGQENE